MIKIFKKIAGIALAILLLFNVGYSFASSGTVTKNPPSPKTVHNAINLNSFTPLKKSVAATLFYNIKGGPPSRKISGSYDFNADGKKDSVSIQFYCVDETRKSSTIKIGASSCSERLHEIAGVYALRIDKSNSHKVLTVVDYGMNNNVTTYFYNYNGKSLTKIGSLAGGIELDSREGYNIPEYNFQILSDGAGRLIPRFGIMNYVSPKVLLSAYELKGLKLASIPIDLNNILPRQFTISMNCQPYFEKDNTNVSNLSPLFDDKDKISLSKGNIITITAINPSVGAQNCASVKLSDGKQGILYFFLRP